MNMAAVTFPHAASIDELALAVLRGALTGEAYIPGDEQYQAASTPWSLHVRQNPALVVMAASTADVAVAVAFAGAHGLPVAVQGAGHGAVLACDGALLINTTRMRGVQIDPMARTARVAAGMKWGPVLEAAQEHGLAPLLGSSPDVGVVGYTLGGGETAAMRP